VSGVLPLWKNKVMSHISLPGVGQASEGQVSAPKYKGDPRYDYIYLFTRPRILEMAAKELNLPKKDFKEPVITMPNDSALMLFKVTGSTPEEAQKKSQVYYQLIVAEIEKLRQSEIDRKKETTETDLDLARQKFNEAQQRLANYQAKTLFRSDEQVTSISSSVESLKVQRIDLSAQEQALKNRIILLSQNVEVPQNNTDAFALQADKVFQEYFTKYGTVSTEYTELSSQLGEKHPSVLDAKSKLDSTIAVLQSRASFVLGRKVSLKEVVNLSTIYLDPQTGVVRSQFFQDLVNSKAQLQSIIAQNQELAKQIQILEANLKIMIEEQRVINQLKLDVELAKALLTSTSAKLEIGKGTDIYAFYPPFNLTDPPNLPDGDEPTSPKKKIGLLGGVGGSFLVTTGLILLWWERTNYQRVASTYTQLSIFGDME
jgi:hypothetical protein